MGSGGALTFWVKELGNAQLPLCQAERMLQVVPGVRMLQVLKVDQVGPENSEEL